MAAAYASRRGSSEVVVLLRADSNVSEASISSGKVVAGLCYQGISTMFSVNIKSREDETLFGSPNTARLGRGNKEKGWLPPRGQQLRGIELGPAIVC